MGHRLKRSDVDVVSGDLLISIPGNGAVVISGDDVLRLALEKGQPIPDGDLDRETDQQPRD